MDIRGCEGYSFLDQAVADYEHGLYSILTDSVETMQLDASFDKPDVTLSSVSFGFLHSVITISDNSKLQLSLSIIS